MSIFDQRTVFECVQERHDGRLANVRPKEIAQCVPCPFFQAGNLSMDRAQHLETGPEDAHWNMNIGDDGVEEVYAVFHVAFLRGVLANVHNAPEYLLQIAVCKNPGIELANIGGIVEDAS